MKQVLIILIPIILLGVSLAGGFTENPLNSGNQSSEIFQLTDSGDSARDVLQIRSLTAGTITQNPTSTPTPGSSAPTSTPTPTPTGTTCTSGQKVAVDFLLDVSGSMNAGTPKKIDTLKTAMTNFASKFRPDDLVGIQIFSSQTAEVYSVCADYGFKFPNSTIACNILPINIYNPFLYSQKVTKLWASGDTYIQDGFIQAKQAISTAQQQHPSGYTWVLVFLTDGIPNVPENGFASLEGPDAVQDPRNFPTVNELKNDLHVRIISIGLDLNSLANSGNYTKPRSEIPAYAQTLLQDVASQPPSSSPTQQNYFISNTGNDLGGVFDQISHQVCL